MLAEEGWTACRNIRQQKNVEHSSNIEAVIDPSGSDHFVSSPYVDSSLAVLGKTSPTTYAAIINRGPRVCCYLMRSRAGRRMPISVSLKISQLIGRRPPPETRQSSGTDKRRHETDMFTCFIKNRTF